MPVWFSLKAYDAKGYQDIVESCIARAQELAAFIEEEDAFELLAPVRLNTVCFSLKGEVYKDQVFEYLRVLNEKGMVFMTPTVYNGRQAIRAAFVNWRTTNDDVLIAIDSLKQALDSL
ncbi:hypothetical protein D3C71_1635650 [compost metagenome]